MRSAWTLILKSVRVKNRFYGTILYLPVHSALHSLMRASYRFSSLDTDFNGAWTDVSQAGLTRHWTLGSLTCLLLSLSLSFVYQLIFFFFYCRHLLPPPPGKTNNTPIYYLNTTWAYSMLTHQNKKQNSFHAILTNHKNSRGGEGGGRTWRILSRATWQSYASFSNGNQNIASVAGLLLNYTFLRGSLTKFWSKAYNPETVDHTFMKLGHSFKIYPLLFCMQPSQPIREESAVVM